MLTKQLRQLEADDLVTREIFKEIPPNVEYSLTDLGRSFSPIGRTLRLGRLQTEAIVLETKRIGGKHELPADPFGLD